jgi:hypothetical protein
MMIQINDVPGRLRAVRIETYGEHGGPVLAENLGISTFAWMSYESGEPVPGWVVLRLIEVAKVEALWLLTGEGRRYQTTSSGKGHTTV